MIVSDVRCICADLSAGEMFLIRPARARAAKLIWPATGFDG